MASHQNEGRLFGMPPKLCRLGHWLLWKIDPCLNVGPTAAQLAAQSGPRRICTRMRGNRNTFIYLLSTIPPSAAQYLGPTLSTYRFQSPTYPRTRVLARPRLPYRPPAGLLAGTRHPIPGAPPIIQLAFLQLHCPKAQRHRYKYFI